MSKSVACALALPFLFVPAERPAFAVAAGARLAKSFQGEASLVLEDSNLTINGEAADLDQLGVPSDMSFDLSLELACQDTYESVLEGRPEVFAVQWHPEMLSDQVDPAFVWLVKESTARAASR